MRSVEGIEKMTIYLEHRAQEERETGIRVVGQTSVHIGPGVGL